MQELFLHGSLAASKRSYWAGRFRDEGWLPAWSAANALLLDMRLTNADYPSDDDRALDRSAHLTLRQWLDRVGHALAGR